MVSILTFTKQVFLSLTFALLVNGMAIPQDDSIKSLGKRGDGFIKVDFDVARGVDRHSLNLTSSNTASFLISGGAHNLKRDEEVVTLINEQTFYATNLQLGSNSQAVTTLLDTGSSDLWVVAKGATCQDPPSGDSSTYCYADGVFDKTTSTTFQNLGTSFSIEYVDGTGSTGTWAKDSVALTSAGVTVTGLQFGDVTTTSSGFGVLGISLLGSESTTNEYPNLPQVLKSEGFISKAAYSLYLAEADATSGTLIFGGIDEDKYSGSLVTLPLTSSAQLSVALKSFTFAGTTTTANVDPVLDSGTTLTYLPSKLVNVIGKALGGTQDSSIGWIVECTSSDTITYNFNGVSIVVPYSEITLPLYYTDGSVADVCGLGILSTTGTPILGDNFLRSAYVAYDLDDQTIGLAQVQYTTSENIVAFT
ncbi:aspartic peptidase domain-containing protein [Scheffersomyces coipomensis]|uniref:aspartic peptidase domain-containing protein n=1 Tax=Scheffersomyces coipomensis TaxID=1788519 RepID=UPI00315C4EC5